MVMLLCITMTLVSCTTVAFIVICCITIVFIVVCCIIMASKIYCTMMIICFYFSWDNGEMEKLSPWDMEPIDPDRKLFSQYFNSIVC